MRLHRLEVAAFGPFSGTEEIDFDALSDAGLFLIQGQTGAGKTSVLDAVCFALYGQVPGARNSVKGLRSDHAPPDEGPRVVLEATIRGRHLRVTRSPAWERPKLRGTGTTAEKAKIILEEREHGSWTGLSTRLDEAGDLISGLLGMNRDQFCQVAMLPQGAFASFLRAGADDRRKVLERLFATEVFTQVEKWLAERRATAGRQAEELRRAAEGVAGRIAETTGSAPPDDLPIEVLPGWAAELAGGHTAVLAAAEGLRAEVSTGLETARTAVQQARSLADRQARHADALRRRAVLEEHAEEKLRLTSQLDTAARADRVVALVHQARQRAERAEETRRRADYARSQVGSLVAPGAAEDVLVKAERTRRDEVAALEGKRGTATRLRQIDTELIALGHERVRLEPEEAQVSASLAELPGRVKEQQAALAEAQIAAAGRPGAEAAVADARRRLDAAQRRDQVAQLIVTTEDARRAAVDAAQEAKDRLQELRQARLDGMAAVLAEELADGEPCLVCGSREHPDPVASLGVIPTEEQVERAQAAFDEAQALRETASGAVESRRAEHDGLLGVAGEMTAEALADDLATAEQTLAAAESRAADAERLEARLRQTEQELDLSRARGDEITTALTENRTQGVQLTAEQDRLRTELDQARGDDASLEARIDRLGREATALDDTVEALRLAERAAEDLAAAHDNATRTATAEGFRTLDEVLAAALEDEDQARLRDRVRRYDDAEAAVRNLLADADLIAAAAEPEPDLPGLDADLALAESSHTAVASAVAQARRRCARLTELRAELVTAVTTWRPAAERHEVAERLAGLASGKSTANRLSMSLSAYVLAARLEQVVAAANERLARMSAGRYVLVHTIDKAAGDRTKGSGGLGLRITDAWTGLDRDPVTLSGGESFITSLALALGLADVVTAEAGGTEINTLFVDEGFGTLDEQTLDEVLDVLDGLRDGGRAVGIVSHVAELRVRIPAQLRLTKGRAGSTADVHV